MSSGTEGVRVPPDGATGPSVGEEQRFTVVDGELVDAGSWVYVWLAGEDVVYVGATGLPPAVRSWLHLHDGSPEIGRVRAEHPEVLESEVEVRAFRVPDGVDRREVKEAVAAGLRDVPAPLQAGPVVARVAAEILHRLRHGVGGDGR